MVILLTRVKTAMSVQEYLDRHKVSQRIEESVNAAVRAKAEDPIVYIASHLRKLSPAGIGGVAARRVFDSWGNPTVEVEIRTSNGRFNSLGLCGQYRRSREELREIYREETVAVALRVVNEVLAPLLLGRDTCAQADIDRLVAAELDKSEIQGALGSSVLLAVSLATCKAGAAEKEVPLHEHIRQLAGTPFPVLPVPAFHVTSERWPPGLLNLTVLPVGADTLSDALRMGAQIHDQLKVIEEERFGRSWSGGRHSGPGESTLSNGAGRDQRSKEDLDTVKEAIERAGLSSKVKIGVDVRAEEGAGAAEDDRAWSKSGHEMLQFFRDICAEYPVASIESPFDDDVAEEARSLAGLKICQVVKVDHTALTPQHVAEVIERGAGNAVSLQVALMGTVTDAIEAVQVARDAGWGVLGLGGGAGAASEDAFLAEFVVGLAAGQIAIPAAGRHSQLAQYDQLLRIEASLGERAKYASGEWRPPL